MNQPVVATYVESGAVYKVGLLFASVRQLWVCLCPLLACFLEKFTQTPSKVVPSMSANECHWVLIQSRALSLINSSTTSRFLGKQSWSRKGKIFWETTLFSWNLPKRQYFSQMLSIQLIFLRWPFVEQLKDILDHLVEHKGNKPSVISRGGLLCHRQSPTLCQGNLETTGIKDVLSYFSSCLPPFWRCSEFRIFLAQWGWRELLLGTAGSYEDAHTHPPFWLQGCNSSFLPKQHTQVQQWWHALCSYLFYLC